MTTTTSERVVRAEHVDKRFVDKTALHDFSLDLSAGEIVGFVGPNGAGKSTFLRLLIGLAFRDGGSVEVLGMDPQSDGLSIRQRTAYLPGETSIYHYMTGRQFLEFSRSFHRQRLELPAVARELFELPLRKKVRAYSAGMKQKLALRATLEADVDLYLLDEPDRALDATARLQLREILEFLRNQGKSVLLSSHHLAEIDALADRSVFIREGRLVPPSAVDAARKLLRQEIRLHLREEIELPSARSIEKQPDGSVRIRVDGEPLEWLTKVPARQVLSAEVGATRLEDVYAALNDLAGSPEATS